MIPGLNNYNNIVGGYAKIISSSAYTMFSSDDCEKEFRILEVKFRITTDGKIYPVFVLEGLNDVYLAQNLMITQTCD